MINGGATEKAYNAKNINGYGFNYAKLIEKELSNSVSKGGLNNANSLNNNIIGNNPHTNLYENGNLMGPGKDLLNKTNYKPNIIDKLQYIQPQQKGYTNNRNLKILESIEQTRQPYARHNVLGANPSLVIDY
jgi:hypothetical protein